MDKPRTTRGENSVKIDQILEQVGQDPGGGDGAQSQAESRSKSSDV
ncbi:hypothetical protein ATI61_110186 [Archangium gephyra]|uniref:Uncharacterized protein n=1 Tax=Archangium gephyra TaxID=48 RepID=A0ABX9JU75_9BACT|nr:hypothetical protein ATI61_110186 [Archangium gephyra]